MVTKHYFVKETIKNNSKNPSIGNWVNQLYTDLCHLHNNNNEYTSNNKKIKLTIPFTVTPKKRL